MTHGTLTKNFLLRPLSYIADLVKCDFNLSFYYLFIIGEVSRNICLGFCLSFLAFFFFCFHVLILCLHIHPHLKKTITFIPKVEC